MAFAFAPVVPAIQKPEQVEKPVTKEPNLSQWYHNPKWRLDIRPMLWSLYNKPEEWTQTTYRLTHNPSCHAVYFSNGWPFYELFGQQCDCETRKLSLGQKWQLRRAVAGWRSTVGRVRSEVEQVKINQRFASHFIKESA